MALPATSLADSMYVSLVSILTLLHRPQLVRTLHE
jgi:hypothetical protein